MVKKGLQTSGFTMVEILIVLAITGILVVLATPGFTTTIQNNLLITEINELRTSLNMARSEAIKRNTSISFCVLKINPEGVISCHDHEDHWHHGWFIFVDNDDDGVVDDDDVILNVHAKLSEKKNKLDFSGTRITFANSGLASNGSDTLFTLCDARGADHAMGIIIGPTGRPRAVTESDDDLVCPL